MERVRADVMGALVVVEMLAAIIAIVDAEVLAPEHVMTFAVNLVAARAPMVVTDLVRAVVVVATMAAPEVALDIVMGALDADPAALVDAMERVILLAPPLVPVRVMAHAPAELLAFN